MCRTLDEVVQKLEKFSDATFHLHVFPRETPEDGVTLESWARVDQATEHLRPLIEAQGLKMHPMKIRPKNGDWIVDVMLGENDEPTMLGAHQHASGRHPMAGALPRLQLPPEAPSRAWLKLEQALAFAGWNEESLIGSVAVELGCAPGGASLALLQHGLKVIGIDTAPMDPRVLENRSFKHLRMSAGAVSQSFLPDQVELLVSDMNLAPPVALHYLDRIQKRVRASRMIITLKMNDGEMEARIHDSLKQLRRFAPHPMRVTQLPANRREICVVAGS
jgi:23S rRNA (cytidine2498-2'-O)-methyltransferase